MSYLIIFGVFLFRFLDVMVETIRLTFLIHNRTLVASIIAFFEVTLFVKVFAAIINHQAQWPWCVAWGAGFALGQYVGGTLGHRINAQLDKKGSK